MDNISKETRFFGVGDVVFLTTSFGMASLVGDNQFLDFVQGVTALVLLVGFIVCGALFSSNAVDDYLNWSKS